MIYILILIYLLIGTIFSGAMQVNGKPSALPLLLWPLVLFLLLIFCAFDIAFWIGEKIADKIG